MITSADRLMALQKQSVHSESEGKETDSLVEKWYGLHSIRVGWLASATAAAFTALLSL